MSYDKAQFQKDIAMVVAVFGERVPVGYFTEGRYREGPYELSDQYTGRKTMTYHGKAITADMAEPSKGIGKWLIERAVDAEEADERGDTLHCWSVQGYHYDPKHDAIFPNF